MLKQRTIKNKEQTFECSSISLLFGFSVFFIKRQTLFFLLMSILSQSFFALMRGHLVSFSFFSAWHDLMRLNINTIIN